MEEVAPNTASKRRRVSVACSSCRVRKSRCNGGRPKCSTCTSNGYECEYEQPTGSAVFSHTESTSSSNFLEARVTELEKLLHSTKSIEPASERISSLQTPDGSHRFRTIESFQDLSSEPRVENVDALASIFLAENGDSYRESPHFGGSSNISLIQQITSQLVVNGDTLFLSRPIEANGSRLPGRTLGDLGQANLHVPGLNFTKEPDPYAFPPVAITDQLIHVYFSTVHLFVPCLDERSFLEKYKACQKGTQRPTVSISGAWLGSFYIVLSLACQCLQATSPELNRAAESEMYYHKAVNAGMKQALYGTGIEIVQFLVLVTAYLQSTHRSIESWTFHSLAAKSALQIALYSKNTFARLPASEQNLRQKCWFCLVYNDQIMSMAFGRPGLIQRSYIVCDFPDENLDEFPPIHVTKKVALLGCLHFRELIKLSILIADITGILYKTGLEDCEKPSVSTVISRVVEALGRLSHWRSRLPTSLRILDSTDLPEPKVSANLDLYSTRFRVFLSLRYLSSRILTYRAILDFFFKDMEMSDNSIHPTESPAPVTLALLEGCADCCRLVIDITQSIVRANGDGVNINGAWWLSAYHVFNASLVLLGVNLAIRHSDLDSFKSRFPDLLVENRISLGDAAVIMQNLDRGNAVIAGCRSVLVRFTRLYDALDAFQPEKSLFGAHSSGSQVPSLIHHDNLGDNEATGAPISIGSLFDDVTAFSTFNFFSDESLYS